MTFTKERYANDPLFKAKADAATLRWYLQNKEQQKLKMRLRYWAKKCPGEPLPTPRPRGRAIPKSVAPCPVVVIQENSDEYSGNWKFVSKETIISFE